MNYFDYATPVPLHLASGHAPSASEQGGSELLPAISIITPSLNRREYIEDAIVSVTRQQYPRVEHIIMDGGSTDGTIDITSRYPEVRLVSGPDIGSHDAMNMGLALAAGDIIGFLNTDDIYAEGCFRDVARYFVEHPQSQAVRGTALFFETDTRGQHLITGELRHYREEDQLWGELLFGAPGFNSWFFRRSVFRDDLPFDTAFYIAADRDFLIRAVIGGLKPDSIPQPLYFYRRHDRSATIDRSGRQSLEILGEHIRIATKFLANPAVPRNHARRLAAWKAFETYQLFRLELRNQGWNKAFSLLFRTLHTHPNFFGDLMRGRATRRHFARQAARYRDKELI